MAENSCSKKAHSEVKANLKTSINSLMSKQSQLQQGRENFQHIGVNKIYFVMPIETI